MWTLSDKTYSSRLILEARHHATPEVLAEIIEAAGTELVTSPLPAPDVPPHELTARHALLEEMGLALLPTTAEYRTAKDAVSAAYRARDLLGNAQVLLDIVGDEASGAPDHEAVLEAASKLLKQGFDVIPVIAHDPVVAQRLTGLGCSALVLRPSDAGPGRGFAALHALLPLRRRLTKEILLVSGAIQRPSEAALALELGFDGVVVGEAIARARDPIGMAESFADAVVAGRMGYDAGLSEARAAETHDPVLGTPVWHTLPEP